MALVTTDQIGLDKGYRQEQTIPTTSALGGIVFDLGADHTGLDIQGDAAQTVDLVTWSNSGGTPMSGISSIGNFRGYTGGVQLDDDVLCAWGTNLPTKWGRQYWDSAAAGGAGALVVTATSTNTLTLSMQPSNSRIEVQGPTKFHFTGTSSGIQLNDQLYITWGTGGDSSMKWSTDQTNHSLMLGLADANMSLILCPLGDIATDYGRAVATNPTLFIQSADESSPSEYLSLWHDGTSGRISCGSGPIQLGTASIATQVLGHFLVGDDLEIRIGNGPDAIILFDTTQTNDGLVIAVNSPRHVIIAEKDDIDVNVNYGHAVATDPTLFIHSSDLLSLNDWIGFWHDQTDGRISTGAGDLNLNAASGAVVVDDDLKVTGTFPVTVEFNVFDSDTDCATGNGVIGYLIPARMNGMNLTYSIAGCETPGAASGTMTVQIRRERGAATADMLSTLMSLATGEYYDDTNDTGVIDTANDDVQTGDRIYVDIDTVHGTPAKGCFVTLLFEEP